jgi:hypothetical protein
MKEKIEVRIKSFEEFQIKDREYLQKVQQEVSIVTQRIIARQGAIDSLKELLNEPEQKTEAVVS